MAARSVDEPTASRISSDDWPLWRSLRRAALADSPEAFGSTLASWSGPGDTEPRWRQRLDSVALNVVLSLADRPVGMVSATGPDHRGASELISLWVEPVARGRGVGDAAVGCVLAWAHAEPDVDLVRLSVRAHNRPAISLYRRHGFVDAGPSPDDGTERLMQVQRQHGFALPG